MKLAFLYGEKEVPLELPASIPVLETKRMARLPHPEEAVRAVLREPIGTKALRRTNACVVHL